MEKQLTHFPEQLGWQERERGFKKFNELFGKKDTTHSLFVYTSTKQYEKGYRHLDSTEEFVYVCEGNLKNLLSDLQIYHFTDHKFVQQNDRVIKLELTKRMFGRDFIRQPELLTIAGTFYCLTKEEFYAIPFETDPITSKREGIFGSKITDSVELNEDLKNFLTNHFTPIKTTEDTYYEMKYFPMVKHEVKSYVPEKTNQKALELAKKHNLTYLEFNFLNFFYETGKAMRNGNAQLFYDIYDKGIGWSHDRKWAKEKMKRLITLDLVKVEKRHDCRDGRYTSWYFYDAAKQLDHLTHDF